MVYWTVTNHHFQVIYSLHWLVSAGTSGVFLCFFFIGAAGETGHALITKWVDWVML